MSATEFTATKVEMDDIPLDGQAADVKGRFEAIYGAEPETRNGWFHPSDWPRAAYVLGRMDPGERALDVGVGAGQFLNMVALSGRYAEVAGLDRARFSKYQEFSEIIARHGLPFVAYNQGSIVHLETAGVMLLDFKHPIKLLRELKPRKHMMEEMGAAYMAQGLITLAGSRMYTSMADTDEVIDEALDRFEYVLASVEGAR